MRIPITLVAAGLTCALLGAGCSDDEGVATGDAPTDGSGTLVDVPDRPPDLVGTITVVSPFEPITEDCTPLAELDPNGAVSSDDPPICTPEDNDVLGTILVEEDPTAAAEGRKVSYTVTTATTITGDTGDRVHVGAFDALAEGMIVDTWVPGDGACAESYPEQCGLEAIRVTG